MKSGIKTYFRMLAEGQEKGALAFVLYGLLYVGSKFYGAALSGIRMLYQMKILPSRRLPFPVISVGNLTWGGSGKTPFVEYLARRIGENHKASLILTRGYSHDEVEQLRHHLPKIEIGIGKDRYKTAQSVSKGKTFDGAILDDGFQHWALQRDLDIVMINALHPFGNGHLIPRGILREPLSSLSRAQIIVMTHSNLVTPEERDALKKKIAQYAPKAVIAEACFEALFFYRAANQSRIPVSRLKGQRVTTFSGVGMPRSFQMLLTKMGIKPVRNFEFTDHHMFQESELREVQQIKAACSAEEIITTEKDFYRDPERISKTINPLVMATRLRISSGEEAVTEKLYRLLGVKR